MNTKKLFLFLLINSSVWNNCIAMNTDDDSSRAARNIARRAYSATVGLKILKAGTRYFFGETAGTACDFFDYCITATSTINAGANGYVAVAERDPGAAFRAFYSGTYAAEKIQNICNQPQSDLLSLQNGTVPCVPATNQTDWQQPENNSIGHITGQKRGSEYILLGDEPPGKKIKLLSKVQNLFSFK